MLSRQGFAFEIHSIFDLVAAAAALAAGICVYKWRLRNALDNTARRLNPFYFLAVTIGTLGGGYLFGTLNLYASGVAATGRSILGALAGATASVEIYKAVRGIKDSTGYIYVVPFCVCVIIGRLGCFLSGLDDHTYGTPTTLPWGHDFGDGIPRHPVQVYESLAMACFLISMLLLLARRPAIFVRYGFYMCAGFYALQRFGWEFLKPYGTVAGPLNIFQCVCIVLFAYSLVMIQTAHERRT